MNSQLSDEFLACFRNLPQTVQAQARRCYQLWRALGVRDDDTITWFWIGSHAEYVALIQ